MLQQTEREAAVSQHKEIVPVLSDKIPAIISAV
jgi:hypothetical protein